MPRRMDFEVKYKAGDAAPFDQANEMWKRPRRDPKLREVGRQFYKHQLPQGRPGYNREDIGFRNAGWFLESKFARGIYESDFGLYSWEDKIQGMSELPRDLEFDASSPEYNTKLVKKAAKFYGASLVGICKLDRRWIYTKGFDLVRRKEFDIKIPDEYEYVINMAIEMSYEHYKYTPTHIAGAGTGVGYSLMAFTAGLMGQFLRQLGQKAIPTGNDTAMSIPYAIQAGLGELGRNGMLVTRPYGGRVRLCKVFTNLPLKCDDPIDFGVTEFCEICRKCADNCPGQAINHGERTTEPINISNAGGTLKWPVDGERCFTFSAKNTVDCGNCIRACPFNKPAGLLHDCSRWVIEHLPIFDRSFLWADDILRYDKQYNPADFWYEK
jgi:reductive dehalogenase